MNESIHHIISLLWICKKERTSFLHNLELYIFVLVSVFIQRKIWILVCQRTSMLYISTIRQSDKKKGLREMKKRMTRLFLSLYYHRLVLDKAGCPERPWKCLCYSLSAFLTSDNIFPWFWKGNHQAWAYRQECYLISQTSEISAQTAAVSRKNNHHLFCRPLSSALVYARWSPTLWFG